MNEMERCYDAKDKPIDDLLLVGGKDAGKEEEIKEINDYEVRFSKIGSDGFWTKSTGSTSLRFFQGTIRNILGYSDAKK